MEIRAVSLTVQVFDIHGHTVAETVCETIPEARKHIKHWQESDDMLVSHIFIPELGLVVPSLRCQV